MDLIETVQNVLWVLLIFVCCQYHNSNTHLSHKYMAYIATLHNNTQVANKYTHPSNAHNMHTWIRHMQFPKHIQAPPHKQQKQYCYYYVLLLLLLLFCCRGCHGGGCCRCCCCCCCCRGGRVNTYLPWTNICPNSHLHISQ